MTKLKADSKVVIDGEETSVIDLLNGYVGDNNKDRYDESYIDGEEVLYKEILSDYLDYIEQYVKLYEIDTELLRRSIKTQIVTEVAMINARTKKKYKTFTNYTSQLLAYLIARVYPTKRIIMNSKVQVETINDYDENNSEFGVYDPQRGIYEIGWKRIGHIAKAFEPTITFASSRKGVYYVDVIDNFETCDDIIEIVPREKNYYLIPCLNCIYDFEHKVKLQYSPDYIFTYQINVNYVENPSPVIFNYKDGTKWDFDSWMKDIFNDNEDDIATMLQIMCAAFMPGLPADVCSILYSWGGASGKTCILEFLKSMWGERNVAVLSLKDFSDKFGLEELTNKHFIICNENDVSDFIESSATFKSLIGQEPIKIQRKFKGSIVCTVQAKVVQATNDLPRFKDRTGGLMRRIIIMEFQNSYVPDSDDTRLVERTEIKNDFVFRKELHEYVFFKLMQLPVFTKIHKSKHCQDVYSDFEIRNDIVKRFYYDELINLPWFMKRLSLVQLYAWFRSWCINTQHINSATIKQSDSFYKELEIIMKQSKDWYFEKDKQLNTESATYKKGFEDWTEDTRYRDHLVDCGLVVRKKNDYVRYAMYDLSDTFLAERSRARGYIERLDVEPTIIKKEVEDKMCEFWSDKNNNHADEQRRYSCRIETFKKPRIA